MNKLLFDMEVYPNYTLMLLKPLGKSNTVYRCELFNDTFSCDLKLGLNDIRNFVENYYLVGFNCYGYDQVILNGLLDGSHSNRDLYNLSSSIIKERRMPWEHSFRAPLDLKLIDLMRISPAIKCGLKVQGARIHVNSIQDLPYHPDSFITNIMRNTLIKYCLNDLDITEKIYYYLEPQVDLRLHIKDQYKDNSVLYKSDPQIAETLLLHELGYTSNHKPKNIAPDKLNYTFPSWFKFTKKRVGNTDLNEFASKLGDALFKVYLAKDFHFKDVIHLDGMDYQFGIGGLHSQESSRACIAGKKELFEVDVTSLYPSIIINEGIYPDSMGIAFLEVYKRFYEERLQAKRAQDKTKSDMLKLVLNGTFGKFDSPYSSIYSTNCLLRTTLTGQLALLMLIDLLGEAGAQVVSANTDSVTVYTDKDVSHVFHEWQAATKLNLERTDYKALYSHSVNNYIAITEDGYKSKGTYVKGSLRNNCKGDIIIDAVVNYLKEGTALMHTLQNNLYDIRPYLFIGYSKEGIIWDGNAYGKCIRYVLSTSQKCAYTNKVKNDGTLYKLPNADSIYVVERLDDMPEECDIDLNAYHLKCLKILEEIGHYDVGKDTRKEVREVLHQLEMDFD